MTNTGDTAVSVCYRTPDQEKEVDEVLNRQLEAASQSQDLVLVGVFALTSSGEATQQTTKNPGGSWKGSMTTSCHR